MTAYVVKRRNGVPCGLFIDGAEVKMTESVVLRNIPEVLPKIEVSIAVLPEDTFEYQDADQG
jgi:hypothetical protein